MSRYRTEDVADVISDVRAQPSKLDAVSHMHMHYPHLSPRWISRHLSRLVEMDTEALVDVLTHSDPTGEKAVRRVMAGQ